MMIHCCLLYVLYYNTSYLICFSFVRCVLRPASIFFFASFAGSRQRTTIIIASESIVQRFTSRFVNFQEHHPHPSSAHIHFESLAIVQYSQHSLLDNTLRGKTMKGIALFLLTISVLSAAGISVSVDGSNFTNSNATVALLSKRRSLKTGAKGKCYKRIRDGSSLSSCESCCTRFDVCGTSKKCKRGCKKNCGKQWTETQAKKDAEENRRADWIKARTIYGEGMELGWVSDRQRTAGGAPGSVTHYDLFRLAYSTYPEKSKKRSDITHEWDVLHTCDDGEGGAHADFFYSDKGHVVLAFRGSMEPFKGKGWTKDWSDNLKAGAERVNGVWVFAGFNKHIERIKSCLEKKLEEFKDERVKISYVTGHSLGGAAATVFSIKYYNVEKYFSGWPAQHGVVTFGAPQTTLNPNARNFGISSKNDAVKKCRVPGTRYFNEADPVAGNMAGGFRHDLANAYERQRSYDWKKVRYDYKTKEVSCDKNSRYAPMSGMGVWDIKRINKYHRMHQMDGWLATTANHVHDM